jgi:hypothetical protein
MIIDVLGLINKNSIQFRLIDFFKLLRVLESPNCFNCGSQSDVFSFSKLIMLS